MIITRSLLRITLGGGGTDLPSYYWRYGGFLIGAAIDKYVYITVHDTFVDDLIVKYSQLERVASAKHVKHPIFREALRILAIDGRAMEIASVADIRAGKGLGSSGSFTTALVKALHAAASQLRQFAHERFLPFRMHMRFGREVAVFVRSGHHIRGITGDEWISSQAIGLEVEPDAAARDS